MTNPIKEELLKACDEVLRDYYPMEFKDDTNPTMVATKLKSLLTEREGWVLVPHKSLQATARKLKLIGEIYEGDQESRKLAAEIEALLAAFEALLAAAPG